MSWMSPASTLLPLVPLLAVFGNALVILAVYRERSLHTVTNLLIVSLAVSDFLVAMCVMSFGVYVEMNQFKWGLGQVVCNVYLAADVICSTASILNLLAISLDRYIAISHPISYAQYGSRNGRAIFSISIVWGVSLAVGFPILLGVNEMTEESCALENPYFNMISSVFSFFIPCGAMIVLYTIIFRRLRQRERARSLRQAAKADSDKISNALLSGARFARQMGTHFKHKADQILLEISFQTSSYPTNSDSSDEEASTSSPTSPHDEAPVPTPESHLSIKVPTAETMSLMRAEDGEPSSAARLLSAPASARQSPSEEELQELQSSIGQLHEQYGTGVTLRSFGEELGELIPYIDSVSRKHSSDGSGISKKRSTRERRRSRRELVSSASATPLTPAPHRANGGSLRERGPPTSNGDVAKCNTATSTTHDQIMALQQKTQQSPLLANNHLHPKIHIPMEKINNMSNGTSATTIASTYGNTTRTTNEKTIGESMRTYKNEIWKRVTSGWKARPSRHLVKKATKQMKREQKATVTLAVVLAVFLFCWLPFFILHLVNSSCMIRSERECIPVMAMFFTTWLGYVNSSLNPLIYTVFDQRFRNAFRNILFCGHKRK